MTPTREVFLFLGERGFLYLLNGCRLNFLERLLYTVKFSTCPEYKSTACHFSTKFFLKKILRPNNIIEINNLINKSTNVVIKWHHKRYCNYTYKGFTQQAFAFKIYRSLKKLFNFFLLFPFALLAFNILSLLETSPPTITKAIMPVAL